MLNISLMLNISTSHIKQLQCYICGGGWILFQAYNYVFKPKPQLFAEFRFNNMYQILLLNFYLYVKCIDSFSDTSCECNTDKGTSTIILGILLGASIICNIILVVYILRRQSTQPQKVMSPTYPAHSDIPIPLTVQQSQRDTSYDSSYTSPLVWFTAFIFNLIHPNSML